MAAVLTKKQMRELSGLDLIMQSEAGRLPMPMEHRVRIADPAFHYRYYGNPHLASESMRKCSAKSIKIIWKVMKYEIVRNGHSEEAYAIGGGGYKRPKALGKP